MLKQRKSVSRRQSPKRIIAATGNAAHMFANGEALLLQRQNRAARLHHGFCRAARFRDDQKTAGR